MAGKSLDKQVVDQLRLAVRGQVIEPGVEGYDEARAVWNAMIDRRPALILRCIGTSDVIAGMKFAREQGLAISIKGGGHNIAGLAVADDALMLDMSLMRGVWVDKQRRIAKAQAGCTLGDVDRETQMHGLAAVLGFISNTGIAGLTLGGGFGYLTRRFGWTCDNVESMDVVTTEGQLVRANESENVDLFWALRGGGGNFGVVVGFDFKLHEVGPEIVGGAIGWPADQAPEVLRLFEKTTAEAPQELTCVMALRKAPPAPWLKPEVHGKDIVAFFICYTGPLEEGEKLLAPIKHFGSPVGDIVQRRSYVSQQNFLDGTQPSGRRYYWKSEYLPGHDPRMLELLARDAALTPSPHSAAIVFPLGGALNELSAEHSPVGNRDANSIFNITSAWDQASDDEANIAWARNTWGNVREFSTGGTYVNFLTEDEGQDRVALAYGSNLPRLAQVKAKWDPNNVLNINKNIAP